MLAADASYDSCRCVCKWSNRSSGFRVSVSITTITSQLMYLSDTYAFNLISASVFRWNLRWCPQEDESCHVKLKALSWLYDFYYLTPLFNSLYMFWFVKNIYSEPLSTTGFTCTMLQSQLRVALEEILIKGLFDWGKNKHFLGTSL